MSQLVLFEDAGFVDLLPLVYWRSVVDLRCGRKSLLDNAAFALARPVAGVWTRDWIAAVSGLRSQTPVNRPATAETLLVNARWLINEPVKFESAPFVATCGDAIAYVACDRALAEKISPEIMLDAKACTRLAREAPSGRIDADLIQYPRDVVTRNAQTLRRHWTGDDRAADGKVSSSAYLIKPDHIHVGERSEIKPTAVVDAEQGPVFISNDVRVEAHAYIEGPVYLGPGCIVKPHSVIRSGTSVGTLCRVGGEIAASILGAYTNKQHQGFLGHAYVGGWVNLGAAVTNSNLKNTYGPIKIPLGNKVVETGLQFMGCVIGDFARVGIGQLIPTGGLAPKQVHSFSWLTDAGKVQTDPPRLLRTIKEIMLRRDVDILDEESDLLDKLPALAEQFGI